MDYGQRTTTVSRNCRNAKFHERPGAVIPLPRDSYSLLRATGPHCRDTRLCFFFFLKKNKKNASSCETARSSTNLDPLRHDESCYVTGFNPRHSFSRRAIDRSRVLVRATLLGDRYDLA